MEKLKGLNQEEVKQSREKYGSNVIPEPEAKTFWGEFRETFGDPMIKILLGIAVIMLVMWALGFSEIYEPVGTIVAILIVATVSAKTGVSSDTAFRDLKHNMKKDQCKVLRDGKTQVIDVDDVVVGDLIILQSGDKVPADGILVQDQLKVDNSSLNGETEACKKRATSPDTKLADDITGDVIVDEYSILKGTVVCDGEGIQLVQRVGTKTLMGKMAEEMNEEEVESPLKVKLSKLANQISTFGYIGATVITVLYIAFFILNSGGINAFLAQGAQGIIQSILKAVSLAVVIIVCAVPEGLPLMIALVLMQNSKKMFNLNVLVRKAIGIETAGSLNILFSDKTGTITKGNLEVVEFFTANGDSIDLKDLYKFKKINECLNMSIGTTSQSMFSNHKVVGGNPTDQVLMNFLGEDAYEVFSSEPKYKPSNIQTFNSTNKFAQAYVPDAGMTFYKGAPERLLSKATKCLNTDGKIIDIDRQLLDQKIDESANKALRMLAFGYSDSHFQEDVINDDIVIIGLIGIRDDIRPEAAKAIKEVQEAGIQVVMITGDRLETARAIARDAGLVKSDADIVLSSAQLNAMSDDEVKKILPGVRVIARASPMDKSRMVRLCQEENLVVGMTGDGVNDCPALKRADVGFAMGERGTEAAKEAGDIVILDDNFQSIRNAILYGRTIYHNILKFCKFQLVINVAAVVVSAIAPFLGIEEPLKVTHLLFVNLVMDGLGAIMLGNEPALERYMTEKPRRRDESIISKPMLTQIITMAIWLIIISFAFLKSDFILEMFGSEEKRLTGYFVLFIVSALFNGFNVRDDGYGIFDRLDENPGFLRVFGIIVLVQAIIVNIALIPITPCQWIGNMFSCTPFAVRGWILVIILAITMIPVDFVRKSLNKSIQ